MAESPIYCFCPQVPFLGLLEALLWFSSEQAAFGWSMRSAPSPQLPYLLPATCSSHCLGSHGAQLGSDSLRSCPSDSPTQKRKVIAMGLTAVRGQGWADGIKATGEREMERMKTFGGKPF